MPHKARQNITTDQGDQNGRTFYPGNPDTVQNNNQRQDGTRHDQVVSIGKSFIAHGLITTAHTD